MEIWRAFPSLTDTEQAFLALLELQSSALEACCEPGRTSFSVVEPVGEGFSWASFGTDGAYLDGGTETTQAQARASALEAQRLWIHRCGAAGKGCSGHCFCPPA